jgi:tetratricopeptide (TPR) repeat protein
MGKLIETLRIRNSNDLDAGSNLLLTLLLLFSSLLFSSDKLSVVTPAEAQAHSNYVPAYSVPNAENDVKKRALEKSAWNGHESNRFKNAGKESLADGDYAEAIKYFDQALKFQFDEQALEGKADCLMKLKRQKEALPILRLLNEKTTSQAAWKMRITCLIDLKNYSEAFAVCDAARQSWYPDSLSFLLRSQVYTGKGDKLAARQSLLDGYCHCVRYQNDKQEILDALKSLGVEPSKTIPKHSEGNALVLSDLELMQKFDAPLNERELSSILRMKFEPGGFGGKPQPVTQWMATDRTSPVEQIMESTSDGELKLRSNLDFTYIAADDLRQKFGQLYDSVDFSKPVEIKSAVDEPRVQQGNASTPKYGWTHSKTPHHSKPNATRHVDRGPEKYVQCPNGYLSFEFSESDPAQLYFVCRHFDTPSVKTSVASQADLDAQLKLVNEALSKRQDAAASSSLEAHWCDIYAGLPPDKVERLLMQKKKLLIQSYRRTPSIQSYLKLANLRYITEDIQTKNRFGTELPSGDQYASKKWHVISSILDPGLPDSYYTIWADTYSAIHVPQSAPLFKILYSQLVNSVQDRGWQRNISGPKSSLIDEID